MADSQMNEGTVLAPSALANENKAAGSKEFFIKTAKYLLTIIGFFIKHPAKLYLGYHKMHFEMLLRVLIAVRKAEPIEKQIKEIEENINKSVEESNLLSTEVRKVPSSPWADMNPLLLILLLPALKNDPEFVKAYNTHLDTYENLVQKAMESAEACLDAGSQIQSGTPPKIQEIRDEIEKLSISGNIGTIIKASYIERLHLVEFDLGQKVREANGATQDSIKYLWACWEKVRTAVRL